MEDFRGSDPIAVEILNNLLNMIRRYEKMDRDLEGVLYLGRKETRAIYTIAHGDTSVNRNMETGEIELYGFPVIEVVRDSYAALAPSKIWTR